MSNKREWEARILEWKQSGMKMAAWCRENGLKASVLGYWNKKLSKTRTKDVQFTEIHPKPISVPTNESKIIIKMGEARIEITETTNLELLGKVVKAISTC